MFDTHAHLNFSAFKKNLDEVIGNAKSAGVDYIVIPGTDVESSKKAVEIAEKYDGIYAAVGIHPHHVYKLKVKSKKLKIQEEIEEIEKLLQSPKVVAVGEVGIDRHIYQKTKYANYAINEEFIELQKEFLKAQIELAIKHNKSLILHNRGAKSDLLEIISKPAVVKTLAGRAVFHCCEPDFAKATSGKPDSLLDFAKKYHIYIGVDGDVTYNKQKQEFVKKIPLELLVFETDSPFLLPEPLRRKNILHLRQGFGGQSNEPKNLKIIAVFIAKIMNVSINQLIDITTQNAKNLFNITSPSAVRRKKEAKKRFLPQVRIHMT